MPFYGVKLPKLQAVWTGYGRILPLEKWTHFVLGPWLLVCQFLGISNQMEVNGHISNFEKKIFYTVVEIKDWQNAILWSKTTQTTGSVDAGRDMGGFSHL